MAVLESGDMRQVGTPQEVYRRPTNAFVASFVGSPPMNLVKVDRAGARTAPGRYADSGPCIGSAGRPCPARHPAKHIRWGGDGPAARVLVREDMGHEVLLTVDVAGQRIVLRSDGSAPPEKTIGTVSLDTREACLYSSVDTRN